MNSIPIILGIGFVERLARYVVHYSRHVLQALQDAFISFHADWFLFQMKFFMLSNFLCTITMDFKCGSYCLCIPLSLKFYV